MLVKNWKKSSVTLHLISVHAQILGRQAICRPLVEHLQNRKFLAREHPMALQFLHRLAS